MAKVPISRQLYSVERLAKLGKTLLKKEGVRESEAEMLIEDARAAYATLKLVQQHEEGFRALIIGSRRAAE